MPRGAQPDNLRSVNRNWIKLLSLNMLSFFCCTLKTSYYALGVFAFPLLCYVAFLCMQNVCEVKKPETYTAWNVWFGVKSLCWPLMCTTMLQSLHKHKYLYIYLKKINTSVSQQTYSCYHHSFDILDHLTLLGMTRPTSAFDWQHPTC